jgi:NADPH:quinone reductase-like Zn-dependent oxidoreductase
MKAAVCERYGAPEVVQIHDVATPEPAADEVLVRAIATTVNSGDARMRALRVPRGLRLPMRLKLGITKPKQPIFGFDVAGQVEAVGRDVTNFQPGDLVIASRAFAFGCHAEFVCVEEDGAIAPIPPNISPESAVAMCFGGSTALDFFKLANFEDGESILVNGASGAVGVMAVQLAKQRGSEVTAVCSGPNAQTVKGLGADHVIDYTSEDWTKNGRQYDVIMDTYGNAPYKRIKGSLNPGGRVLMVAGDLATMIAASRQRAVITRTEKNSPATDANFRTLMALAADGQLRPVIDTVLPFQQVAEAHRRVDTGHKVGSVVLTHQH